MYLEYIRNSQKTDITVKYADIMGIASFLTNYGTLNLKIF